MERKAIWTLAYVQATVKSWVLSTFGKSIGMNVHERALRVVEEATELAQSVGVERYQVLRLVWYVYGRKVGQHEQELAGTMVTLAAAAASLGVDLQTVTAHEVARIQTPEIVARCRRRQKEKRRAGVTGDSVPAGAEEG